MGESDGKSIEQGTRDGVAEEEEWQAGEEIAEGGIHGRGTDLNKEEAQACSDG